MPLFFMIAGFCYLCRDYKTYMRKKFFRLVIPYIVFNMIDMLPRQLLASLVRRPKPMSESIIKAMFYGGEFWFIYALFIIFMIYPIVHKYLAAGRFRMSVAALIFLGVSLHGVNVSIFLINRVVYYLFFFHVGVMLKDFTGSTWPSLRMSVYALPLAFCLWLVMLFGVHGFGVFTALLGILTCYIMTHYKFFNYVFSRFGGYSLQLYLLNGITLGISRAIICNILHVHNPAVIIAFNMLVDFFASYMLIKYVFMKSKILRLLIGA